MARPKAFNEAEALAAAMHCFWERGFEATSVRDLTERMGICSPSLYNAFKDKRTLFSRALDLYCARLTGERIQRLDAEFPPALRIGAFMAEVIEKSCDDPQRRGCFLINSAIEVAPLDPELRGLIQGHLAQVRHFFLRALEASCEMGQIPADVSCARAADHLMAVLLGVRVLARIRQDRAELEGIVDAALAPLELVRPARGTGRAH